MNAWAAYYVEVGQCTEAEAQDWVGGLVAQAEAAGVHAPPEPAVSAAAASDPTSNPADAPAGSIVQADAAGPHPPPEHAAADAAVHDPNANPSEVPPADAPAAAAVEPDAGDAQPVQVPAWQGHSAADAPRSADGLTADSDLGRASAGAAPAEAAGPDAVSTLGIDAPVGTDSAAAAEDSRGETAATTEEVPAAAAAAADARAAAKANGSCAGASSMEPAASSSSLGEWAAATKRAQPDFGKLAGVCAGTPGL